MLVNYRFILRFLGYLSWGTGLFMLTAVPWAFWFGDSARALGGLVGAAAACGICGVALVFPGRHAIPKTLLQRDALALVGLSWLWVALLGALPYVFTGELEPVDAFFESMSGFTTTGSTVMTGLDSAPRSLVFWRSLTHWLGGLGIVIMIVAVLPYLGTGGKMLFLRESTGPDPRGIQPRIRQTAVDLYKIYIGITVLGTAALMVVGMSFYEALNHCFAALATGGFSTRYNSIASFESLSIEVVTIILMLVGGASFTLYFRVLHGEWRAPLRDTEFKVYLGIFVVATALVTLNLMGLEASLDEVRDAERVGATIIPPGELGAGIPQPRARYEFGHALRVASFQVGSLMTDTGFVTDNSDVWPYLSRMILLVVTITGGCVSSTAGGMKIFRVIILFKMAAAHIERAFRPKVVRAMKLGREVIGEELQHKILVYFFLYVAWFTFAILVMSGLGLPFDSAVSSVVATMNNCGPGLEFVGASTDFALLSPAGKLFLSLTMLVGRLEIVTILALFAPSFWLKK